MLTAAKKINVLCLVIIASLLMFASLDLALVRIAEPHLEKIFRIVLCETFGRRVDSTLKCNGGP